MARNKYPEVTVNKIIDVSLKLFLQKGYDHTTVQDIVDNLGGLSKGAIYHHYKSKEDILEAVLSKMYESVNSEVYALKNSIEGMALERLKKMVKISLENPNQKIVLEAAPNMMKNPRFLAAQINSSINELAHEVLQPLIEQGNIDGSVSCQFPRETAEIAALLLNIWINPFVFECSQEELKQKFLFLKDLLDKMNLPLFDETTLPMISGYNC